MSSYLPKNMFYMATCYFIECHVLNSLRDLLLAKKNCFAYKRYQVSFFTN